VASIELALKEACSVAVKAVRRGQLTADQAGRVVEAALLLVQSNVRTYPQVGLIREAVKFASTEGITLYDALYIALAKQLRLPLVSLDAIVTESARKAGVTVIGRQ
jgi:predicted nucleic acid-binding protein